MFCGKAESFFVFRGFGSLIGDFVSNSKCEFIKWKGETQLVLIAALNKIVEPISDNEH